MPTDPEILATLLVPNQIVGLIEIYGNLWNREIDYKAFAGPICAEVLMRATKWLRCTQQNFRTFSNVDSQNF